MLSKRDASLCKETVKKIEDGAFQESDIEYILTKLRNHVDPDSLFRELAHFIAHEQRDIGITFKRLYKLKCQMLVLFNHQVGVNARRPVKLHEGEVIEKWLYDYFIFQLEDLEHSKLRMLGFESKTSASKFLRGYFSKEKEVVTLIKYADEKFQSLILSLSSILNIQPVFTMDSVINEFIKYLRRFKLLSNEKIFRDRSQCITLALLAMLHKREIYLEGRPFGLLTIESTSFTKGDGDGIKQGVLSLGGSIYMKDGPDIGMPIFMTNLEFKNCCDGSLTAPAYDSEINLDIFIFNSLADVRLGSGYMLYKVD